ncbi:MAG: hypothetical protein ABW072_18985 [Sedimenticola sp.]
MPNKLLARYFEARDVELGVEFGDLTETQVEHIFEAFTALPEEQQTGMDIDFQDINTLATDGGIDALRNEAAFYEDATFLEEISSIDGLHAKAMWAFLHKPEYWKGASALLHADMVTDRSWKKRNDLPKVPPHVGGEDIDQLEKAISHYFNKIEGRGRNCKVETYRKVETGREYFFAYPEDYGRSCVEWERNSLITRPRHPAFEIIFVYSEAEGSLDIYAPKNTKAVPELQKLFAKAILKLDTLADVAIDKRVYNLDPLADPDFEFQFPSGSGISEAIVTKIQVTLKHGSRRRLTLEADTKQNSMAVYDLLKEVYLPPYYITQVSIKAVFKAEPGKRAGSKTFTVTYPNTCNLNYVERDEIVRQMLTASGIEPQAPKDNSDA